MQSCKLVRQSDESEEEWRGWLKAKGVEYKYKEYDRRLKEWLINEINDKMMRAK